MDTEKIRADIIDQIDMLWQHAEKGPLMSDAFIRNHALMLLQLSELRLLTTERAKAPAIEEKQRAREKASGPINMRPYCAGA